MTNTKIALWMRNSPVMQAVSEEVKAEVRRFAEGQMARNRELVKIGMALSAEKKLENLLEMIVSEARRYTNADGGTLYIKNEREELEFKIIQNDTLGIRAGRGGEHIDWAPIALREGGGRENHRNVSAHCALVGKAVNIDDVYSADFDFEGTRRFDAKTGYRSKSMLLVPLRGHEDEVIGVLQLLNAMDPDTGGVVGFGDLGIDDITSLASQAAIAITNVRLVKELELLFDSFLKVIATAIDEKSPYTSGHVANVAELTLKIAEEINRDRNGRFAEVNFSEDELAELKMAAWLHDIGKITTPEHVVDKGTKLETIFDRIELVKTRLEIIKRDAEIKALKAELAGRDGGAEVFVDGLKQFDGLLAFLEEVNIGGEYLSDEKIEKIKEISGESYQTGAGGVPLLNDEEIVNLSIRKGTLNDDERRIINDHVRLTQKMLTELSFPRKLKKVPEIAGMHHEKLDCSGYPNGLCAKEIPLAARILAVADIFEALTAADRPYKHGKKLSESIGILGMMVGANHLDEDVCDLMIRSGIVRQYVQDRVDVRQHDDFEWKGEKFPWTES
ncbi:MAG: HD domain-containing phosphohydrolase [Desulfurivibrionaceae bacterium]|nr:HD domain-containing phosphohydrolase [Desulfurivibrionaceae bacterium]